MSRLKVGDTVFTTGYLKDNKGIFYVCKCEILDVPGGHRKTYRVKITSVADRAVGKNQVVEQSSLLGLVISKSPDELVQNLAPFMRPRKWIDL